MIEYIPNQIHIPCDCSECVKNEAILDRLKKRIEETDKIIMQMNITINKISSTPCENEEERKSALLNYNSISKRLG
ncbi:hypothetical protein LCGC14_2857940, partial [marine sediment metagenome]